MNNEPTDPLSICVNANFTANALEEFAEIKRGIIADGARLNVRSERWAERLDRWSRSDLAAAQRIRELVKEVDRLREFEWMYKDLCK